MLLPTDVAATTLLILLPRELNAASQMPKEQLEAGEVYDAEELHDVAFLTGDESAGAVKPGEKLPNLSSPLV